MKENLEVNDAFRGDLTLSRIGTAGCPFPADSASPEAFSVLVRLLHHLERSLKYHRSIAT